MSFLSLWLHMPCASAPFLKWDNDIPFLCPLTSAITGLESSGTLSVSTALYKSLPLYKISGYFKSVIYIENEGANHHMFYDYLVENM